MTVLQHSVSAWNPSRCSWSWPSCLRGPRVLSWFIKHNKLLITYWQLIFKFQEICSRNIRPVQPTYALWVSGRLSDLSSSALAEAEPVFFVWKKNIYINRKQRIQHTELLRWLLYMFLLTCGHDLSFLWPWINTLRSQAKRLESNLWPCDV